MPLSVEEPPAFRKPTFGVRVINCLKREAATGWGWMGGGGRGRNFFFYSGRVAVGPILRGTMTVSFVTFASPIVMLKVEIKVGGGHPSDPN